jgi:hypothetical protein
MLATSVGPWCIDVRVGDEGSMGVGVGVRDEGGVGVGVGVRDEGNVGVGVGMGDEGGVGVGVGVGDKGGGDGSISLRTTALNATTPKNSITKMTTCVFSFLS